MPKSGLLSGTDGRVSMRRLTNDKTIGHSTAKLMSDRKLLREDGTRLLAKDSTFRRRNALHFERHRRPI